MVLALVQGWAVAALAVADVAAAAAATACWARVAVLATAADPEPAWAVELLGTEGCLGGQAYVGHAQHNMALQAFFLCAPFSAASQQLRGETQRAAGASSTRQAARRRPTLPPGVGEQIAHRARRHQRTSPRTAGAAAGGERALRGDCEEGSPPPHVRLHSSSAQQIGNTVRLGAREQAHEGNPAREPPATDLEAEDKQAAAPAPEELRVSVVALAASNLAQG